MSKTTLAPSGAALRMKCPGSRAMQLRVPYEPSGEAALEGIRAHAVAEQAVQAFVSGKPFDYSGLSDEMAHAVRLYVDTIASYCGRGDTEVRVESRIDLSLLAKGASGIVDCALLTQDATTVIDFKYGHTPVEAYENWQLIAYAMGLWNSSTRGLRNEYEFNLIIVQPRAFAGDKVKVWTIKLEEMRAYFARLCDSEWLSLTPDAPLLPSPACEYCRARGICPALGAKAEEIAKEMDEPAPQVRSESSLGAELKRLAAAKRMLDARYLGIEQEVKERLSSGKSVLYFSLAQGRGRYSWDKSKTETILQYGQLCGLDLTKPVELITPTQARDKGMPEGLLDSCTIKEAGAVKVVEDNPRTVKKLFAGAA